MMMNYGKVSVLFLMIFNLLSCGGGGDSTFPNNQYDNIHLKPSNLRVNQVHSRSVVSSADYAYVASRSNEGNLVSGVLIYPLANYSSKQSISEVNFLEMNSEKVTLAHRDNVLYAGGYYNFSVIDVTDPINPVVLSVLDYPAGNGLKIYDNYLFAFNFSGVLNIFDIIDPTNPVLLSTLTDAGNSTAYANNLVYTNALITKIGSQGGYIITSSEINTVDISDPTNPVTITRTALGKIAYHLEIVNNHLVALIEELNGSYSQLQVYSLSDPKNPILIDTLKFDSAMRGFGAIDSYGVVSGYKNISMFKISNAGKIEILKTDTNDFSYLPDGFPYHIDVQTNYAILPGLGKTILKSAP